MASTVFTDFVTPVPAAWLNDANTATYVTVPANTVSIAANTADLLLKAPLASPTFTDIPTVPTAASGTNTTQIASTAFVQTAVSSSTTAPVTPLPNITVGPGVLTAAHALGVVPSLVVLELVCLTAEFGYAIGDVVQITVVSNGANNYKLELFKNASLVGYATLTSLQWQINNRTVNGMAYCTAASWSLRFRVFK